MAKFTYSNLKLRYEEKMGYSVTDEQMGAKIGQQRTPPKPFSKQAAQKWRHGRLARIELDTLQAMVDFFSLALGERVTANDLIEIE